MKTMGKAEEMRNTLQELCAIKAPTRMEGERAEYCRAFLQQHGIEAFIDEVGNVISCYGLREDGRNYLFMAHLDTVFDLSVSNELVRDGKIWRCPGIGDDTGNAVDLLYLCVSLNETKPSLPYGILFAWNVGEEGLGNLYGCIHLMDTYQEKLRAVFSFDLYSKAVYTECIGSVRYEISVETEGGHSFLNFGNENAIEAAARLIERLYRYQAPSHTTYNVGVIEGGTSVNTIAESCRFYFEYRSNKDGEIKKAMEFLDHTLQEFQSEKCQIQKKLLGYRPCMGAVDPEKIAGYAKLASKSIRAVTGETPVYEMSSTDCNIPLSRGIPAICFGLIVGGNAHKLEEWIEIDSLEDGLEILLEFVKELGEAEKNGESI